MKLFKFLSPQARALLQVFSWTVGIIVGLAAFNFLFILHRVGPGLSIDDLPVKINRDLASLSKAEIQGKAVKTPVLNFHCKNQKVLKNLRTFAPTTRVRLSRCPEEVSVVNTANSSEGELFTMDNGVRTSDFLPLVVGKNEILVKFGEKSIKLMIIRDKDGVHGSANSKRPSS